MGSEEQVDRRTLLQGLSVATATALAGCNTLSGGDSSSGTSETPTDSDNSSQEDGSDKDGSGNTATPTPAPEFGDPEVNLGFPDHVEAWSDYQLDGGIDAKPEVETVTVGLEGEHPVEDETFEDQVNQGDTYSPPTWGTFNASIHVEGIGDQQYTEEQQIEVRPHTPDAFEQDEFHTFFDQLEEEETDKDRFLHEFTGLRSYTTRSQRVFNPLNQLLEQDQTEHAVNLTATITEYLTSTDNGLGTDDLTYIQATTDSTEEYTEAIASGSLEEFFKYDGIRQFEEELFNFGDVLEELEENPYFDHKEYPNELQEDAIEDFTEMRDDLLEDGLGETDIEYLQIATEYLLLHGSPIKPIWEVAKDTEYQGTSLWGEIAEKGHITEDELEQFKNIDPHPQSPADNYSDDIKENVIGIEPDKDTVLMQVNYTENTDYEDNKELFQYFIDYMSQRYGINIIGLEGDTNVEETYNWEDVWDRFYDRQDQIEDWGMHSFLFTGETDVYGGSAWLASKLDFRCGFVDTSHIRMTVESNVAQEIAHIFGSNGQEWDEVEYPETEKGEKSYISYDYNWPQAFVAEDVQLMREDSYGLGDVKMSELEELEERDRTLRDEFDTVYTPETVEI